jgi:uncharacterized cupredoxin-like copper-binding protein
MRRLALTAVVVLLLGSACTSRGGGSTAASPPSTTLAVTATEYRFDAAPAVPAGAVRVDARNRGKLAHEVSVLRVGDTPVPKAVSDFASVTAGGAIPEYLGANGGVSKLKPGTSGSSTLTLTPGRYLIVCSLTDADSREDATVGNEGGGEATGPAHDTLGKAKELTVTAPVPKKGSTTVATDAPRLPSTDGSIVAHDYGFDVKGLHGGKNEITFTNTGPVQIHHVVILEFPGLASAEDVRKNWEKLVAAGDGPPAPGTVAPKAVGSAQPLDPGLSGTFTVTLEAGHLYGIACFISDRTGGPPHAFAHDMFTPVAIP